MIQLANCFDLLDTRFTGELRETHRLLEELAAASKTTLPRDTGADRDLKLRRLDCAVLNLHLDLAEQQGTRYDTVRGAFVEGEPAFPDSMIRAETHVQVAVRNPACVLGVFRPTINRR